MRVPEHQKKSYVWRWTAALAALAVLAFALATSVTIAPSQPAHADNLTVTTTTDGTGVGFACPAAGGDPCSLREAVAVAEANVVTDAITFAGALTGTISIGGTISLTSAFATTITGPTDHSITVNGAGAGGPCFAITSDNNTIKNLVINSCTGDGITINSANSNTIAGNRIGTNGGGTVALPNTGHGVHILGTSTLNTIGGTATADRNLISGNLGNGVELASVSVNTIRGNYIGTDVTGSAAAIGNGGDGINLTGTAATNSIRDNVIGGNTGAGITLGGSGGNTVYGNSIGLGADGAAIMGNGAQGILNSLGTNLIGGTASGQPNTIAHNGGDAVEVTVGGAANIRRNSMFLNTGVGITNLLGPTTPGIPVATFGGGTFTIGGTAPFFSVVEVFLADPDGDEGQTFVQTYNADGAGNWGGSLCVTGPVRIAASATDTTANDTSEFGFRDLPVGVCVVATSTPVPTSTSSVPTDTPTNTNTPTVTGTRTNTPTNTPTGTLTPAPGAMETVSLAGGVCNPVASTYANGTATSVLAAAVTPTTALRSIWKFQANVWAGYDPLHPNDLNISDLRTVSFLDSIFICLTANATFQRPQVSA